MGESCMLLKIFVALIVLLGIAVGILASALPRDQLVHLIVFRDFFDISLPILAFGALVKYLCSCPKRGCGCCGPDKTKCSTGTK
jgi:hypothetical protein